MICLSSYYGHSVRILYWCTDQTVTSTLASMDLTSAQGHIMGFISHCDHPPCCRDIEEEFHLSHPTVSGILSRLEKKGFIEFRPDIRDRRCIRIYIMPRGAECNEWIHKTILANEEQMVRGFTDGEKAQFAAFLERAIINMGGSLCCPIHKEEPIE